MANVGVLATAPALSDLLTGWRLVTSLIGVVVIAFVAGRLLGARRSLAATLISALVGWVGGAALAVVVARNHEGGDAGFTRNLWLFATFFTMSATVWMEMLAKPGALARAQQRVGRLSSLPRPVRDARRKGQRVQRYLQITRIAARHGLGRSLGLPEAGDDPAGAGDEGGPADQRVPTAVRLRLALEDAGGMFIKLGQVMSTRADLLPPAAVAELSKLQDHVNPAGRDEVERLLGEELGRPVGELGEVFAEFEWTPLAAASIGQAHRARLRSGEAVIVKVQRPGIADAVNRDLDVRNQLGRTVEARVAWAAEYRVMDLIDEFSDRLREELDFRIEARNAIEIGANLTAVAGITVPRIHTELTTPRILVQQWLEGVSARHVDRIDEMGLDRRRLADVLLRAALQQMLVDGHFHADPHPGNVMVLPDGRVGLIDFGASGRLDAVQQTALREMLLAVSQQDADLLRQAVLEVAEVRSGFDDDQFERALARFMGRHLRPGSSPSAAMFNELLQLLFSFGLTLPPELSTFFRALVTLEGTITTLSPGYPVIDAAQRLAKEWAREQLAPDSVEKLARQELLRLAPVLRRLPRHVDRLATIAERGDLRAKVSLFSGVEDVRVITKLLNRVLLAFLGFAVGLISVGLIGISGGPEFTGQTSLYEFFGYFGLFCSTVLIMRVLIAILRDGDH